LLALSSWFLGICFVCISVCVRVFLGIDDVLRPVVLVLWCFGWVHDVLYFVSILGFVCFVFWGLQVFGLFVWFVMVFVF